MKKQNRTREYKLFVSNSFPEELFISKYGQELFDSLRESAMGIDRGICSGCGHEPPEYRKKDCLSFHIYEINETKPELSRGVTLCKMCHATQHIEDAIKNNWVYFVNSIHSQNAIIGIIRYEILKAHFDTRRIVGLKNITPEKFLKDSQKGKAEYTSTLKVVFNNNFIIDDVY